MRQSIFEQGGVPRDLGEQAGPLKQISTQCFKRPGTNCPGWNHTIIDETKMTRLYRRLLITLMVASTPLVSSADDYREEIMYYVVGQCYADIAKANKELQEPLSIEEAAMLMEMMEPDVIDGVVSTLQPLVEKARSLEERMQMYAVVRKLCISSSLKNQ